MDVTVLSHGKSSTIHATQHHPFWDLTRHAWVEADQLPAGDELLSDDSADVSVQGTTVTAGAADMWDLTITGVHDFYVSANQSTVLLHNIDTCKTASDLSAFGNASGPRAPRDGLDYVVGQDGNVVPQSGDSPLGASAFADPGSSGLTGVFHTIPRGTEMPQGLGALRDGADVGVFS